MKERKIACHAELIEGRKKERKNVEAKSCALVF